MSRRRMNLLLFGAGASVVGWRVWSRRRTSADEISFDWNVPPAPETAIPHTAAEAAESAEPAPAPLPEREPETAPAATGAAEGRAEREAESQDDESTRFEERGERESEERRAAAERLGSEPLPGPDSDTDL